MWIKYCDILLDLNKTTNIIKYSKVLICFFKDFPVFSKNSKDFDRPFDNAFYFRFNTEAERDAYWDKHIIPLLNK